MAQEPAETTTEEPLRPLRRADYTADTSTVVAVAVVGGVDAGAAEVRVAGVGATADRTRPIVAAATRAVQRATVDVASADKE